MKLENWLEEWLTTCVKPIRKGRTLEKYERTVKKTIVPALGGYEMDDLRAPVIQKFIAEASAEYSPSTVRGYMSVLRGALQSAVRSGMAARQYTADVVCPAVDEPATICLDRTEQKKLESYILARGSTKLYGIILCLYTGIRIGELFALTWDDCDFRGERLSITKSCRDGWVKGEYRKIIETPKTRKSRREIPLPKQLIPLLRKMKKSSDGKYVVYGKGKPISVRSYQKTFELVLKKAGVRHKPFHALRHTFATRAMECGMDVKTLSEILGHKNPMMTLNRYAHSMPEYKTAMMNKVGRLLQQGENPPQKKFMHYPNP